MADDRSVSALLAQSRASHAVAKRARQQGRVDDHFSAIQDALTLREAAHLKDPDHLDQAWSAELPLKFNHDALIAFYQSELSKDHAQERIVAQSRLSKGLEIVAESAVGKAGVQ